MRERVKTTDGEGNWIDGELMGFCGVDGEVRVVVKVREFLVQRSLYQVRCMVGGLWKPIENNEVVRL